MARIGLCKTCTAFEPLSLLWKKCLELGKIPETWAHARTVFIDKPCGDGKRPLSIAAICWRLVASAAVADLKPWIQSWADDSLCGCLPEHRADELHVRLFRAFHSLGNQQNKKCSRFKTRPGKMLCSLLSPPSTSNPCQIWNALRLWHV